MRWSKDRGYFWSVDGTRILSVQGCSVFLSPAMSSAFVTLRATPPLSSLQRGRPLLRSLATARKGKKAKVWGAHRPPPPPPADPTPFGIRAVQIAAYAGVIYGGYTMGVHNGYFLPVEEIPKLFRDVRKSKEEVRRHLLCRVATQSTSQAANQPTSCHLAQGDEPNAVPYQSLRTTHDATAWRPVCLIMCIKCVPLFPSTLLRFLI